MQPDRWRKIEDIFQSALDCPPETRSALLDTACGADTELRRELESLLSSYDASGSTTYSAAADAVAVLGQQNARIEEGRPIGAYRIVREIGRGGMGTVYLAARADDAFHKLVAIKVIRRGLDTDDIIQRFRGERHILAMLDHPNISRLLDGGTTGDGLPYFVMEYIEGEPIDLYSERRKLSVGQKLRLFQSVCEAVNYAHQHLVIHRDIKPANVLVTKEGVARLLDFGIAKLLVPGAANQQNTITGLRPLTPECASPEQVRGEPVTTASDIYSLGVLLYRLLTGNRPYRSAMSSPVEIERAICEEEPEKPSENAPKELRKRLQGDLDTIVLKALQKEPRRRYGSVEQFSEDIRRHLANLPVIARPETLRYRAAKFVRRNKAWVAMAAITFLSLSGGIAASFWQTHIARREQAKAARISEFLQDVVGYSRTGGGSQNQKGIQATVADLLEDAARRVETELRDQPEVQAELLHTIGGTYANRGQIEPAARYLAEAYALDLKLFGPQSLETAKVMYALGVLDYKKADYVTADSWFSKAVPIGRKHAGDGDSERVWFVSMLGDAAFGKRAVGQFPAAEALWREALVYAPKLPPKYRGMSMELKTFLARLAIDRGDVQKADPLAYEAVEELRAFGADRIALAQSMLDLGNVRRLEKRYAEAESLIRDGTGLYRRMQGDDHPNVAGGLLGLAEVHYDQGRYDLAEQEARAAGKIVEKLPRGSNYRANLDSSMGRVLNQTGKSREAEPLLEEAVAIRRKSLSRLVLAAPLGSLGECLAAQNRFAEAEPLLIESYQIYKSMHIPESPVLREAHERLARLYAAWGKPMPLAN